MNSNMHYFYSKHFEVLIINFWFITLIEIGFVSIIIVVDYWFVIIVINWSYSFTYYFDHLVIECVHSCHGFIV